MSLRDLDIPRVIDSSNHDFVADFFEPVLSNSTVYDRGVGFFSSGWLRINCRGLASFAENGGRARWITSPILSEKDVKALEKGERARKSAWLKETLEEDISELKTSLREETQNAFAWLIADEVIELRIATPRGKLTGEFHDKFGIFEDSNGDSISFNGSYNDSIQGLRNYESIKIFRSWDEGGREAVQADRERFNRLWNDQDPNLGIHSLPEAVQAQLIQMRSDERPYSSPPASRERHSTSQPKIPIEISLRGYQKDAIKSWFRNNGQGILEMATGTGKTITALSLTTRLREYLQDQNVSLVVITICPYQHLVDQWEDEARNYGFEPILCYRSRRRWKPKVNRKVTDVNTGLDNLLFLISTNATFRSSAFQKVIASIQSPILLIADEVHNVGSNQLLARLPAKAKFRLGLSATPEHPYDDERNDQLRDYFGPSVFRFGLGEAIERGYLCDYEYFPIPVQLTASELEDYLQLTAQIGPRLQSSSSDDPTKDESLKMLLIKRARILANAENKIRALERVLGQEALSDTVHNLFYCGAGTVEDSTSGEEQRQIDAVTRLVGRNLGMDVAQYVAETTPEQRRQILTDFEEGDLQGLVAIRCLDEGVDVPATRRAFILASTTNPRQFIQRRGRVLRTAPGKDLARIWDFLVIPSGGHLNDSTFNAERNLIRRELERVEEFAKTARNGPQARASLLELKKEFNLLDI